MGHPSECPSQSPIPLIRTELNSPSLPSHSPESVGGIYAFAGICPLVVPFWAGTRTSRCEASKPVGWIEPVGNKNASRLVYDQSAGIDNPLLCECRGIFVLADSPGC